MRASDGETGMLLVIALQAATAVVPLRMTVLDRGCVETTEADTITVCGGRKDRYRLPLPDDREPAANAAPLDRGSGSAALRPSGRCGMFAGERRCGKAEARAYGYGDGRDPVTLAGRLLTTLAEGE